jgi:predicted nuclease with TOPRIM domain
MAMNENKAQYEAKLAELIKENESLKAEKNELEGELNKFENGFIRLQENFEKQQDYTAKLVMAYKVAMSGGLTTDEKVQISEQFDKCESVEEAEKLYKSIVSEHNIKVNKNPEKSIKSTSIKSSTPAKSVSQPLYESAEITRMKQLAGIKKNEL